MRTRSFEAWLLTAIVLFGLFVRLHRLGALGLAGNEDYLAISVARILDTGVPTFPTGIVYPRALPLAYLTAGFAALLGTGEAILRLPSALFSTLAILGVFLLARRLLSPPVALLAALLMAVSDWEVEMGRLARMYSMFSACAVYCLWLMDRLAERPGDRRRGPFLAITLLTCWTHQIALALGVMYTALWLRFPFDRRRMRLWLTSLGLVAIGAGSYFLFVKSQYALWDALAPEGAQVGRAEGRLEAFTGRYLIPIRTLFDHYRAGFAALAAAAVTTVVAAAIALRRRPQYWLFSTFFPLAVITALAQQLTLTAVVMIAYVLLARRFEPESVSSRLVPALAVLVAIGMAWLAFSTLVSAPLADEAVTLKGILKPLIGYPPNFVRLFVSRYPVMSLLAMAAVCVSTARYLRSGRVCGLGATVLLFLGPMLFLGFHPQSIGRTEPRYVFFLNPYFLMLAAFGASWTVDQIRRRVPGRALGQGLAGVYVLLLVLATDGAGARASMALVSADYGANVDVLDRKTGKDYFHSDLVGGASFVATASRDVDLVVAMDILGSYAYFPKADYQLTLFGKPDAEGWMGVASLTSAGDLEEILDRNPDHVIWILLAANHLQWFEDDPRMVAIVRLIRERAGEPVYSGRDGLSDVFRISPEVPGSR